MEQRGGRGRGRRGGEATSLWDRLVAASAGAVVTSILVTPLDVVKVRMQAIPLWKRSRTSVSGGRGRPFSHILDAVEACTCRKLSYYSASPSMALRPSVTSLPHSRITGTLDGLVRIAQGEGMTGLWRGLTPTMLIALPSTVIYYLGYETLRDALLRSSMRLRSPVSSFDQDRHPPSPRPHWTVQSSASLVAGSVARIVAASVISPLELLKTRMQFYRASASAAGGGTAALLTAWRDIRQQGAALASTPSGGIIPAQVRIWYRGLVPTLWRDVPFSAIYWASYEAVKHWYAGKWLRSRAAPDVLDTISLSFVSGATAGMVAAMITTPFDVAKTRRQLYFNDNHGNAPAPDGSRGSMHSKSCPVHQSKGSTLPSTSILAHLKHIWRNEGLAGLTLGMGPRIAKVAPSCAIMISCYEATRHLLSS